MVDQRLLDSSTTSLREQCCSPFVSWMPTWNDPVAMNTLIAYAISYTHHTYLYFFDPNSGVPIQTRHFSLTVLGMWLFTVFPTRPHIGLLTLSLNHFLDLVEPAPKLSKLLKVHHIVTLTLLSWSYVYDFRNYGLIVMLAHDITDVPMFMIRIIRRLGIRQLSIQVPVWITVIVTWFVYRIHWFGVVIVNTWPHRNIGGWNGHVCIFGMILLWVLNVYWWLLTVKKGVSQVLGYAEEHHEE